MSNFETWWEREGQEFLYAINTTTDDDIKLVAEIAWKNGAYCAEQAEPSQLADASLEPVAWLYECGTDRGDAVNEIRWYPTVSLLKPTCLARNVRPLYATPQPVSQEPVAWCELTKAGEISYFDGKPIIMPGKIGNDCHPTPLYAAPARTKDLTDDEIVSLINSVWFLDELMVAKVNFARAVIAADREKNK